MSLGWSGTRGLDELLEWRVDFRGSRSKACYCLRHTELTSTLTTQRPPSDNPATTKQRTPLVLTPGQRSDHSSAAVANDRLPRADGPRNRRKGICGEFGVAEFNINDAAQLTETKTRQDGVSCLILLSQIRHNGSGSKPPPRSSAAALAPRC